MPMRRRLFMMAEGYLVKERVKLGLSNAGLAWSLDFAIMAIMIDDYWLNTARHLTLLELRLCPRSGRGCR